MYNYCLRNWDSFASGENKHECVMAFMSWQVSREGESVALGPNLKARGAVEDWLTAMEENMRKVLHRFIKVALVELEGINFDGGDATRETLHIIPLD